MYNCLFDCHHQKKNQKRGSHFPRRKLASLTVFFFFLILRSIFVSKNLLLKIKYFLTKMNFETQKVLTWLVVFSTHSHLRGTFVTLVKKFSYHTFSILSSHLLVLNFLHKIPKIPLAFLFFHFR